MQSSKLFKYTGVFYIMVEKTEYKYETLPDPKAELHAWVLETAKDIDAKLCEYADSWEERGGSGTTQSIRRKDLLETQNTRIDLIKAVMEK